MASISPILLSATQTATLLGIGKTKLYDLIRKGKFPAGIAINGEGAEKNSARRWHRDTVEAWARNIGGVV